MREPYAERAASSGVVFFMARAAQPLAGVHGYYHSYLDVAKKTIKLTSFCVLLTTMNTSIGISYQVDVNININRLKRASQIRRRITPSITCCAIT